MNYQLDKISFCVRSSWGILELTGDDRVRYLHNQSTNNFNLLKPGEGCQTVFLTSTARTLDLATTYLTEDAILVIVSPNRHQQLLKWLDGFIFPFDRVKLTDISEKFGLITLIGESSHNLVRQLFSVDLEQQPEGNHQLATYQDTTFRVAKGSDLALPGYNLIVERENLAKICSLLTEHQISEIDSNAWEQLRILQGRPASDRELTEEYNPLEAGLWHTISLEKGCYIGQETIARLNTYKGLKQKLWGVKLDRRVNPEATVTVDKTKVGVLTSYAETNTGEPFGLAYVRTKVAKEGLIVDIGDATGELVTVPFLSYEL